MVALVLVAITLTLGFILIMWNRDRSVLTADEAFRHQALLSQARGSFARGDIIAAGNQVQPLLTSTYVGPEAQLLYAGSLVMDRQPNEAVSMLEQLLHNRPEIAGAAHALLARILWESPSSNTDQRKKMDAHQQQAEALLPETAEAYFLRALTAFTIKEKMELLYQALRLDPGHYESRRLRALTYFASRKYQDMEHDALGMIILKRNDPLGYSLRATAWHHLKQYSKAIEHYDLALEHTLKEDPKYVELLTHRCDTLLYMGQYDRVISDVQAVMQPERERHWRLISASSVP